MKITKVEPILVDRYLFVQVHTDEGLVGLGESGAWGFHESAAAAVVKFGEYLLGEDPLRIEHHWQYLYRAFHFRGADIMGALSAIDIALWDLAGQYRDASVHALLGGPVRERARVYQHVVGTTRQELVAGVKAAKEQGFTAVGHLTPFLDEDRSVPYFETHAAKIGHAIEAVGAYRDAVGDDVDLCIEIHRRLTPAEAVQLGLGIAEFRPQFLEDPVTPDNFDEMEYVASRVDVPIATGERLTSIWEFAMLLRRSAVQFVRPNVGMVGGITGAKKIAALAEAQHVGVVPHNPLSPVLTAASLQIAAAIPNFALLEYPGRTWHSLLADRPDGGEIVTGQPEYDGRGFLLVDASPGIGVKLRPDVTERVPYVPRPVKARLSIDGSVIDQ
ncbi:mandelate racemase/muconate lactonizing enzyme family protein [Amycolatopsis sp. NPDC050768]|uniref:mandelate racemase/muconate lactonizing enzyme family protein n=1 Tax=Amycolatopsis sp. NPDC050768 TaxID=3154839 RepID=UPI0033D73F59